MNKATTHSKRLWLDIIYILLGILSASVGLKGFIIPNGFYDGGAMGISLFLNHFIKTELSIFIVLVNIPFVFIGSKQISVSFAIKSSIAIFLLAISVHFLNIQPITSDKLLIALFGGSLLGIGVGLSMRGGAVIDGTEALAVQVSRRYSLSVGDFVALFNAALFILVAFFINIETAMYSMLTYVAASKGIDFIISGIEEYIGVTIISHHFEAIRSMLVNDLNRGVTVYKTLGGYGKTGFAPSETDSRAIFCVVTRLEVSRIVSEIQNIDAEAFVIQHSIKDTRGGMIKKRPLH